MFSQSKAIIYLRRNDLIIAGKHIAPGKQAIPADVVSNLEVLDAERFLNLCKDFFSEHKLHGQPALLILDPSIVFYKSVVLGESERDSIAGIAGAYIEAIPLATGTRACLTIRQQSRLELYATNSVLYGTVQEALRQNGVKNVAAITPAAAYKLEADVIPSVAFELYASRKEVYRVADFSTVTPS